MKNNNLLHLLNYSKDHGLIKEPVEGGEREGDKKPAPETHMVKDVDPLQISLKNLISQNNKWLAVIYVILFLLIVFLSVILWKKMDDEKFFFAILSGQGLSILVCVNRISHLYKQKRATEILLHLYQASRSKLERQKLVDQIIIFLKGKS